MATCPRCKGHLTDSHRCPRRPVIVIAEIAAAAVIGGIAGLLVVALFDPSGQVANLDLLSAIAGALVAVGMTRVFRT